MTVATATLKKITDALLDRGLDYLEIRNTCIALSHFFYEISGFDKSRKEAGEDIPVSSGQAISPNMAALCITDIMRTRSFLRGLEDAINDRLDFNPRQPVVIFYAGTGPFATLLVPLTTRFTAQQMQIVMLEIHPYSIICLKQLIGELGIGDYVMEVVNADATMHRITPAQQPDILLIETMQAAMKKESQLSIVSNLLAQCTRQPLLLPQKITVEAALLGNFLEDPAHIMILETLMELDSLLALQVAKDPSLIDILDQGIPVTIPAQSDEEYKQLALLTSIQVYKKHRIGFNECGLTLPLKVLEENPFQPFPARLRFKYEMGDMPGFRFSVIESET